MTCGAHFSAIPWVVAGGSIASALIGMQGVPPAITGANIGPTSPYFRSFWKMAISHFGRFWVGQSDHRESRYGRSWVV